jgi:hypothetical protein
VLIDFESEACTVFRDLSGARPCVAGRNDRGVIKIRLRSIDRRVVGIDRSDDLIRPGFQLGRPVAGCQKPSGQSARSLKVLHRGKQVGLLGLRREQPRLVETGSILASLLPLRFGDLRGEQCQSSIRLSVA